MADHSKLLINEHPLQALPTLAKLVGLDKAVILQQIQYWISTSGHEIDGELWIYNSYTEWSVQFPWLTPEGVRYHIRELEKTGYLIADTFNKKNGDKTKWYRIDYEKLDAMLKATAEVLKTTHGVLKTTEHPLETTDHYHRLPETTTETTITSKEKEDKEKEFDAEPKLTPTDYEKQVIAVWRGVKGFRASQDNCIILTRRIQEVYPEINILDESNAWAARKLSEPLTKKAKPLGQIWNWMRKAQEFKNGKTGRFTQRQAVGNFGIGDPLD